jgi:rod shape-determining protein MreC
MNSLGDLSINKKRSSWKKFLAGFLFLLIFIFALNFFSPEIKNYFYSFSLPFQKTLWSVGKNSSGFLASLINSGANWQENENLKKENQNLLVKVAYLESINNANEAQTNVSLACENKNFNLLMAGIMGFEEQGIVSIDKGSENGIKENMPVINQQNVLFGKVVEVNKNFSKVMLISNKNSAVNVEISQLSKPVSVPEEKIEGDTEGEVVNEDKSEEKKISIQALLKGNGGTEVYLDLIPINEEIKEGDTLVTSSLEKVFPKNLLVGTISKIQKDDQKPFQQATVNPFFDIKSSDYLFVITNYPGI